MKKLTFFLLITLMITLSLSAENWKKTVRGNGNVTKELREMDSFNGINASAGINVYLFHGDEEKIVVETDENLQGCLKTELNGSVLKCYMDCQVRKATKLNVYVNFKTLELIKASSGSDVYGETPILVDHLDINVSSGADVKIEVDASVVSCDVSSGSDAVIKGKADHFNGDASSGADIKAGDLEVKSCNVSASSAGDIRITVKEKIEARASSGGDIVYYGNPEIEHINESSGGDVKNK